MSSTRVYDRALGVFATADLDCPYSSDLLPPNPCVGFIHRERRKEGRNLSALEGSLDRA